MGRRARRRRPAVFDLAVFDRSPNDGPGGAHAPPHLEPRRPPPGPRGFFQGAGTGSSVVFLIASMAKAADTSASGATAISRL